jgi:hypothetical protein
MLIAQSAMGASGANVGDKTAKPELAAAKKEGNSLSIMSNSLSGAFSWLDAFVFLRWFLCKEASATATV